MNNKKTIKDQYKQAVQPMGVYQIKNLVNGKIFMGTSKNLPGKINSHRFQLKMGSHMNKALQAEFNCYGEKNFSFEVLDSLEPKKDPAYDYGPDLDVLEKMWLENLQPYGEKGYHKNKS